jgi:hypothetical protein
MLHMRTSPAINEGISLALEVGLLAASYAKMEVKVNSGRKFAIKNGCEA